MNITSLINGTVTYDNDGQYFFVNEPSGNCLMILEMRGWGRIQNMFKDKKGDINEEEAGKFQDEVGTWIAEAINEKIKRELNNKK